MSYPSHLDQFHIDRNTKAFYKSQGYRKLLNSFEDFTKKEEFQEFILGLREKYKIPPNGFLIKGSTWTTPPKEWISEIWSVEHREVQTVIKEFCENQQIPSKDWKFVIEQYLFFNKIFLSQEPNSHNLCYVTDISTKKDSLGQDLTKDLILAYPVGLLISPYASKRDILDYIEHIFTTEIKPLQEKYENEDSFIGKSRQKMTLTKKRANLVWENQDKPLKEIAELIKTVLGTDIDVGAVGKLLSLERKKRKKQV